MHDRGWGDLKPLQRSYLVEDLLRDAKGLGLSKSVHVQANFNPADPVGETRWLEKIAHPCGFLLKRGAANSGRPCCRLEAGARHPAGAQPASESGPESSPQGLPVG